MGVFLKGKPQTTFVIPTHKAARQKPAAYIQCIYCVVIHRQIELNVTVILRLKVLCHISATFSLFVIKISLKHTKLRLNSCFSSKRTRHYCNVNAFSCHAYRLVNVQKPRPLLSILKIGKTRSNS